MKGILIRWLFLVLPCFWPAASIAQVDLAGLPAAMEPPQIRIDRIPGDVLPAGNAQSVVQGPEGFLWVADSFMGLFKYDGYAAERVVFETLETPTVQIYQLIFDRHGILWMATDVGLFRHDPSSGASSRYHNDGQQERSLSHDRVQGLLEDSDGTLWVAHQLGLDRYEPDSDEFRFFPHLPDEPSHNASMRGKHLVEDSQGRLWMGAWGMSRFDPETGAFTRFLPSLPDGSESDGRIDALLKDSRGRIWVGTNSGNLYLFDPDDGTFASYLEPLGAFQQSIRSIAEDPQGGLWMGIREGHLIWFDPETKRHVVHRHDPQEPKSLPNGPMSGVYPDRQGGLWVSISGAGLGHVDRTARQFPVYFRKPVDPMQRLYYGEGPFGIADAPDGAVWALTGLGQWSVFYRIDREGGTTRPFLHDPDNPNSPTRIAPRAVGVDLAGTLWAGGARLARMDFDRPGHFTYHEHDPADTTSIGPGYMDALMVDSQGRLWTGHRNGVLSRMDIARPGVFTRFILDPEIGAVHSIYEDAAGILWVGTLDRGLYRFDPDTRQYEQYGHDPARAGRGVSSPWIEGICETKKDPNTLWVAAYNGGLNRFDKRSRSFSYLTTQNSDLPHDGVFGLLCDEDVWMSTDNGLANYLPDLNVFNTYTRDDGLQGTSFLNPAYYKSPFTGEMFFGGNNGINSFLPGEVWGNPYPPEVSLTGLSVFGKPLPVGGDSPLSQPLANTETVTLSHDQNDITLEYVGLHYGNSEANQFAYRLEPYDAEWRMVGSQRTAYYSNVEPGTYQFRVKAASSHGVWNETGRTLQVIILPPWWRTWWAYLAYGALLIGVLVVVDRAQRRRLRRLAEQETQVRASEIRAETAEMEARLAAEHAQRLKDLDVAKSRFFANISHEFRTPLTLILGPLEDLSYEISPGDPSQSALQSALRNGRRLLRLVNQLLDVSRLESGRMTLQARRADLVGFTRDAAQAFLLVAERNEISFRLEMPDQEVMAYFDPDQLEKVLGNLLGNAFKFTLAGGTILLTVTTRNEDGSEYAEVSVRDSGPGIADDDLDHLFDRFYQADASSTRRYAGTGIGLALVKSLMDLHHGSVRVKSQLGLGSTFTARLRLGKEHLGDHEMADASDVDDFRERYEALLSSEDAHRAEAGPRSPGTLAPEETDHAQVDATTILIVEDNEEVRAYTRQQLTPSYRVHEAENGERGLSLVRSELPDLVISDVMMPEMDGYTLCRAIKSDPELDFIPVILLTAKSSTESKLEGLEGGADDYLTKPFNGAELKARVENLITQRRRLKNRLATWQGADSVKHRILPIHASPVALSDGEVAFVDALHEAIENGMSDEHFSVDVLASQLSMSRATLYRRFGAISEERPMDLIWRMRLERAAQLLRSGEAMVSEVAYGVGFKSVAHFSHRFQDHFGATPTAYAAALKHADE